MAISKIILNGVTQMDVTTDTVEASSLLSGKQATKNDGTKVSGSIASKGSADLTVSGATVTAPAGFYASDASASVATATQATPSISVNSTTGLITATATQTEGYVAAGTKSDTEQLTVQAAKTVAPTESEQTAVAASRFTTGAIKVGAISSTYVGSGIDQRDSDDLTASGATVTVPVGYYATQASKTVAGGSAFTPATTITANPTISVNASGLVTATAAATQNITPTVNAGYITAGTAGTVTVEGSKTLQLSTKSASTITPTKASQTAVAAGLYTLGAVTVEPIPSAYIIPSGTLSITSNSTYDVTQYASVAVDVEGGMADEEWYKISGLHNMSFSISLSSIRLGAFAETSICGVSGDSLTSIPNYAFYGCKLLSEISFQSATQIGMHAFEGCTQLTQISFPEVTYIQEAAFSNCTNITAANTPKLLNAGNGIFFNCIRMSYIDTTNLQRINDLTFARCLSLTEFNGSMVSYVGSSAFYSCSNLTSVSMPSVQSLSTQPFSGCSKLSYIYMPALSSVPTNAFLKLSMLQTIDITSAKVLGSYCFSGCILLSSVIAPNVISIHNSVFRSTAIERYIGKYTNYIMGGAFMDCVQLSYVLLSKSSGTMTIQSSAFANCTNLISLYLLGFNIYSIANLNVFASTPIYNYSDVAGRWGSIFVPASLYDTYRAATNWAPLADRFVSLTDAEIEELLAE